MTVAGALALTLSASGWAQTPIRVEFTPVLGAQFFASELPAQFTVEKADGGLAQFANMELGTVATYGAALGVRLFERIGLEGNLLYAPATLKPKTGAGTEYDVNFMLVGGSASVLLPAPVNRLTPYLVVGAGAKIYNFDDDAFESPVDLSWNVGAGAQLDVMPGLALVAEVRDHMSQFKSGVAGVDDRLQNDITLVAGLRLTVGGSQGIAVRR